MPHSRSDHLRCRVHCRPERSGLTYINGAVAEFGYAELGALEIALAHLSGKYRVVWQVSGEF